MLDLLPLHPEPPTAPPEAEAAPQAGLNMGRHLALIVIAMAALLGLVNLPFSPYGQLQPKATALVIYDGMLLQGSGADIYRLEEHQLRRLADPAAFKAAYFPRASIHTVEDSLLAQFAQGRPIRRWLKCLTDPNIYTLENGQKHLCPQGCPQTANAALPWDQPHLVSCQYLHSLPDGPAIPVEAESAPAVQEAVTSYGFGRVPGLPKLWGAAFGAIFPAALPWLGGGVILSGAMWLAWRRFGPKTRPGQEAVAAALRYQAQIERALKTTPGDQAQQQLRVRIAAWIKAIQDLARRIAVLQQDDLICREQSAVPRAIEALQAQLARTTDAALHRQLQRALANRQNQLASLEGLQRTITQAEIQIENTLSLLGLIYSQILTGQSTRHMADYSRLAAEVDEEVQRLQDRLEALREVKGEYLTKDFVLAN